LLGQSTAFRSTGLPLHAQFDRPLPDLGVWNKSECRLQGKNPKKETIIMRPRAPDVNHANGVAAFRSIYELLHWDNGELG
jgi:hypothetical protein